MYQFDLRGTKKYQDIEELIKVFLPPEDFRILADDRETPEGEADKSFVIEPGDKNAMKRRIFDILSEETGSRPEWGIMTGVRPVKLAGEMLAKEGREKTLQILKETYYLSDAKAKEIVEIREYQSDSIGEPPEDTIGLYLGIPFCPTRCLYCAFTSNQAKDGEIERYLEALHKEVRYTGKLMRDMGTRAESIYFGGGTPTTLTAPQLTELLTLVREEIPQEGCREFTLEAGRPDTITPEKLKAAKDLGVTRLSINPQTMKDHTLELIGRAHSVADIYRAFEEANAAGFTDINCDLIAGLPEETPEDFVDSVTKVLALKPTNVTVHTLAVKRSSRLKDVDDHYHYKMGDVVQKMLDYSREALPAAGFAPYYLYRQKHMAGAGENTGWCLPGTEGVYNIRIMDEHQPIIAMGAGGISKSYYPRENRIERAANVSNYEQYITRIDEMLERKYRLYADFIKETR